MTRKQPKYQWTAGGDSTDDDWVSRSQRKRDSTALQRMGEDLCGLGEGQLQSLELPDILLDAVKEWKRINDHEGKRRQMQYIGRIMREDADAARIQAALSAVADGQAVDVRRLKAVESLREQLMSAPLTALPGLCAPFGEQADAVRALAEKARAEAAASRPPHAFRALFRLLRGCVPDTV